VSGGQAGEPPVLDIRDLGFAYPGQAALASGWTASIGAGVTLLHGDTGSGKSTLLRVLAGTLGVLVLLLGLSGVIGRVMRWLPMPIVMAMIAGALIRFGTGDLSALLPGISACGRTNLRLKGWMGRADQTAKVKGMFVHPSQVADIVRRHPAITRARLVVANPEGNDTMVLHVEIAGNVPPDIDAIVATIRDVTKLRGDVEIRKPGELPNDGKIIDDTRTIA
jgi:hypothetical protein